VGAKAVPDQTGDGNQQGDHEDGPNTTRQGDLESAIDGDGAGRAGQRIDQLADRRCGRIDPGGHKTAAKCQLSTAPMTLPPMLRLN
jgi:hypothetical protein